MHICSDKHDEVCYAGWSCPCCVLLEQVANLLRKNDDLSGECGDLEEALREELEVKKDVQIQQITPK